MTQLPVGVGIIGVEPGRSWSAVAHIPALQALPQYRLVAVSTRRQDTADAAAQAYGIPHAFGDHRALVTHPEVDLVVIAVKVPHHLELVGAAIEAGKSVYCEWPLGNGLAEAAGMAELARSKSAVAVVGLQARAAPIVNYVRDLVRAGELGEILSTTLVGSGVNWGAIVDPPNIYTLDRRNGATLLTIPFGHGVDALCYALGELSEVGAVTAVRRRASTVSGSAQTVPMTAEDQVAVNGVLEGGAVVSIHYRGGTSRGVGLLWEINGTKGDLQILAAGGHLQLFDLTLKGGWGEKGGLDLIEVPARYSRAPAVPGPAFNVAQMYAQLAEDLRSGSRTCPDFDTAVARHRLLAAVERSAASGQRVQLLG